MHHPPLPRPNTFAGLSLTLDRQAERREDGAWLAEQAAAETTRFLLLDADGEAFLNTGSDTLRWLDSHEMAGLPDNTTRSLLGVSGTTTYFSLALDASAMVAPLEAALTARRANLRAVGQLLPAEEAGLFAYAKGLSHWQRSPRHCQRCGAPLSLVAAGHRAQCTHPDCAQLHFPRTDAAVIMLVEHGDACLLGRQPSWPAGRYSTLAGFVEPGESLEDAVRREVAEEAGVIVAEVRYHSSQPWPMPASLMVGFMASAVGREITLRDKELEEARWFTAAQIIDGIADGSFLPAPPLSVSYQLLACWLHERTGAALDSLVAAAGH